MTKDQTCIEDAQTRLLGSLSNKGQNFIPRLLMFIYKKNMKQFLLVFKMVLSKNSNISSRFNK